MTIDSNILIAYFNADRELRTVLNKWKATSQPLLVSTISIAEVLSFTNLTTHDIKRIEVFLEQHFLNVHVDSVIAREAGRIRRRYGLKLPDAIIAATALVTRTPLVTRDDDFAKVNELELIVP